MGKKIVVGALGCVAGLGFVVAAAAVGFYLYWTSPTYSLRQVRKAVDARDLARFEKYVDIRGICDSGVDRWLTDTPKAQGAEGERWERALSAGVIMLMKPAMVEGLRKEIRKAIEEGRVAVDGESRVELNIDEVVKDSRGALVWLVLPGRRFDPPRTRMRTCRSACGTWGRIGKPTRSSSSKVSRPPPIPDDRLSAVTAIRVITDD